MKHPESKAQPGDKLAIKASLWNDVIDLVKDAKRRTNITGQDYIDDSFGSSLYCLVRNDSVVDLEKAYYVLGNAGVVINVDERPYNSLDRPAMRGFVPDASHNDILIVQQPLKAGEVGRAIFKGFAVVKVAFNDVAHKYARAVFGTGTVTHLETAASGPAKILWIEALAPEEGDDVRWAFVDIIGNTVGGDGDGGGVFGGNCACGWIQGVESGDCFGLSLVRPTEDAPDPIPLIWQVPEDEDDPTNGYALAATDPETDLPYTFEICGRVYNVVLFKDIYGNPAFTLTDEDENEYVLSLNCCLSNGAYFTGRGVPDCWDERPASGIATPPPSNGTFMIKVEWGTAGCFVSYLKCHYNAGNPAGPTPDRYLPLRLYLSVVAESDCTAPLAVFPVDFEFDENVPIGTQPTRGDWYSRISYGALTAKLPLTQGPEVVSINDEVIIYAGFRCVHDPQQNNQPTNSSYVRMDASILVRGTINNLGGGGGVIHNWPIFKPALENIIVDGRDGYYTPTPGVTWNPFSYSTVILTNSTNYPSWAAALTPCPPGNRNVGSIRFALTEDDPS